MILIILKDIFVSEKSSLLVFFLSFRFITGDIPNLGFADVVLEIDESLRCVPNH